MDLEELKPEFTMLRGAVDELRHSTAIKRVLQVVLAVGNALNASTFRGNARGFQLEALLKLRDTKAVDANAGPTLLHYVVRQLNKVDPALVDFLADLPHIEGASRGLFDYVAVMRALICRTVSLASVQQTTAGFVSGLASLQEELRLARRSTLVPGDRFVSSMEARTRVKASDERS